MTQYNLNITNVLLDDVAFNDGEVELLAGEDFSAGAERLYLQKDNHFS